jgi:hypothetical protein
MRARMNAVIASLVLCLGIAGVAVAGIANRSATATEVDITLRDGKLAVSPTTFTAGKVILVVTNKGKVAHALAIMGTRLQPRHTPTLKSGKSATLTLTLVIGKYHVWDTITSSMSRATMLMVKAPKTSVITSGGSTSGGTTSGGTTSGGSTSPPAGPGGGTGTLTTDDPCAGHTM